MAKISNKIIKKVIFGFLKIKEIDSMVVMFLKNLDICIIRYFE
tara:strand:- start:2017 stop:2145 length:129 start_codon:yes stop_codon:yes gene_type:complete